MLETNAATFENIHFVKVVPDIKQSSDFLHMVFHDWIWVAMGIVDRISSGWIHLELQHTSEASLTTTHLHNHKHIVQVESTHVLVDCLSLLMPIANDGEEVDFVNVQFFGFERRDPMLCDDHCWKHFLDRFVLEPNHISTSDSHMLIMRAAANYASRGNCNVKDSIHFEGGLKPLKLKIRSGHWWALQD